MSNSKAFVVPPRNQIPMIDIEDLTDLELLKTHRMYSSDFEDLPRERQEEIYKYCKCHATWYGCTATLEQIRYAVARIYFGY